MAAFTLLEQVEEDKLHANRLWGYEERPFKRIIKRLLEPSNPINSFYTRSVDAKSEESDSAASELQHQQFLKNIQRFRDEAILDFAAFDSSIARIQYLRAANERERDRYAAEKLKIEATAEEVRENTADLRVQLDEAQKNLAIRKTYDVLADRITKNASLKPRDEQHVNIEKLKAEIEELERESQEHNQAWVDRREQFSRLVTESQRLRRVVRDEKEPEKDEDATEQDDENLLGTDRERDPLSNAGTPRMMDDAPTPLPGLHGALSPRSNIGGATPLRGDDVEMDGLGGADAPPAVIVDKPVDEMDMS
ncbi:hypothetical protein LTR84_011171 [Exophiala bonariae]|uniref:Tho complex subunit 7 n=1 Tax=Exophiala bonariae TaxID=1690606 RepID=A0AAV9NID5_9EURO|nr:hypothetical protein LTR84_011171 [Exophiala bonariae]